MHGREHEWETVTALLGDAGTRRGATLLVEGAPGTGKSLLLAEAAAAATARTFGLATGGTDELGQLSPLAPLYSALDGGPVAPREFHDALDPRPWRVEELRARFEERAAGGPLLVTLDDLQWAAPTMLMAVWTLRQQLGALPVVWILVRETAGQPEAAERLFAVLRDDGAYHLELAPLRQDAVVALVADLIGALPGPRLLALAAGAGGNPALLVELVSGLCDEGALRVTDGRAEVSRTGLPLRVRELVARRLEPLSPPARRLLETASVLGHEFAPEDAAGLLGTPLPALLPALEEVLAAGALAGAGDRLAFRHDLVRQAVAAGLLPAVRQALRRQIRAGPPARGVAAVPPAEYLPRAGRHGDARSRGSPVGPVSPETAAELAVRAFGLTAVTDPQWVARALRAVDATADTGRLDDALALAVGALAEPLAASAAADLRCALAAVHQLAGRGADAVAEADAVLAAPDVPDTARDRATLVLLAVPDGERVTALADAVLDTPGGRDDAVVTAALAARARARWDAGRIAEAVRLAGEAVGRARAGSREARRTHPALLLASMLTALRCPDEAAAVVRDARAEIDALGQRSFAPGAAVLAARLELAAGHLDAAATEAEGALGEHVFAPAARSVLAEVALRGGDLRTAERYADGDLYLSGGWLREARDGAVAAAAHLARVYDRLPGCPGVLAGDPTAAARLVRIALAAGDRARAGATVAAAEGLVRDNPGFPALGASAVHARGLLDADPDCLGRAAERAAEAWVRASAGEDLGVLLAARDGRRPEAVRRLETALAGYDGDGAVRDAARVRLRLRRLGVRHRHWSYAERPVAGWDSLTGTEAAVAVLVAQGWTNPQIAGQMYLSAHTVAYHLRRVFRKLDVASRVDLTRVAVEGGHLPAAAGR
jgi:DNA-binding CsgD family transcriptional regulator